MADTPRITRRYSTRLPKYTTRYRTPTNWSAFNPSDFVLMAIVIILYVKTYSGWILGIGLVLVIAKLVRRLGRVERDICGVEGHVPYRPIPEVAEWRCRRCTARLDGSNGELALREAVREVEDAHLADRPQSFYSDRR